MNRQLVPFFNRFAILIYICLFVFVNQLHATDYEIVKVDTVEYEVQSDGLLTIRVGTGQLDIKVWDQPRIFIEIKKWVNDDNQEDAEKRLSDLEIEFSNNRSGLLMRELARGSKNPFSSLLRSAGVKSGPKSRIDFRILVPRIMSIDITKEGGDTELNEIHGNLTVNQGKGSLKVAGLGCKRLEMKLDFVRADIGFLNGESQEEVHINLSIDQGELSLRDARIVRLVAKSKKADLYLVNNEISSGEVRLDSGDFFFNSNLDTGSRLRVHSDSGDMYILLPSQPDFAIKAETGLGLIGNEQGWDMEDKGSGYLIERPSLLQDAGRGEFIAEIGDIFIQKKWTQ